VTDAERNRKFLAERRRQLKSRTRIQRDTQKEITRLLKTAEKRAREALAAAPSDWEQFYLPQLQRSVNQALGEFGQQASGVISTATGTSWQAGINLVDQPIAAGGIRLDALLPSINTGQLQAMRTFTTDRMADVGLRTANKINSELGLVAIGAQNQGAAIGNISKLIKGSRGRATTIIRTELGRAYSVASHQRQTQAKELLPGLKKQWRRSGKLRDRPHHTSIDGQIRETEETFTLGNGVAILHPRHPAAPIKEVINCGCESLPFMESWEVQNPGRKPFSPDEIAADPFKRDLQTARDDLAAGAAKPSRGEKLPLDSAIKAGRRELDAVLGGATSMPHEQFKRRLTERLASARDMSGTAKVVTRGKGATLIKAASADFPREWVTAADNLGPLHTKSTTGRAFQLTMPRSGSTRIGGFGSRQVVKGEGFIAAGNANAATHEYAHRLQHAMPELDDYFQELHGRRTAGDPLNRLAELTGNRRYGPERAREDGYIDPYFGKEYRLPGEYYSGRHGALEVMTMSVEALLSPRTDVDFERFIREDRELAELTTGLLFNYAP